MSCIMNINGINKARRCIPGTEDVMIDAALIYCNNPKAVINSLSMSRVVGLL